MNPKVFGNKKIKSNETAKLAYLFIFNAYPELTFHKKDLNFGSSSIFKMKDLGNSAYELLQSNNENFLESFYDNHLSVSCIVGKNGAGKTTLLKTLQFIINEDAIYQRSHGVIEKTFSYIAIFQIGETFYYRLSNTQGITILKNKLPVSSSFDEFESEQTSIFYSGYPDISFEYNFDEPGYIDVSTDFLIHKKYSKKDEESSEKQVTYFKREDIKMQIAFLAHVETEKKMKSNMTFIDRFIPTSGQVACFGYIQKFDTEARYIDYDSIKVYNLLRQTFRYDESILIHEIREEVSVKDPVNKRRVFVNTKMGKLFLLRFYMRLVEQFFYNTEYREHKGLDFRKKIIKDEKDHIFQENNVSGFRTFFAIQTLIDGEKKKKLFDCISSVEQLSRNLVWEINEQFFDCNINTMKALIREEKEILKLFPDRWNLDLFVFQWRGISTGERAMLSLFSRLNEAAEVRNKFFTEKKRLFILLDEPELAYHPQWQQEYLSYIIKYINWRFSACSRHLIICTHSPFILSDIPDYSVIKLGDEPSAVYERKTLGTNIYDLLADSFYLPSGFMGGIAKKKILDLTNYLLRKNQKFDATSAKKLINLIGEPLIKDRLETLYNERFKSEPTKEQLINKIIELEAQLKKSK